MKKFLIILFLLGCHREYRTGLRLHGPDCQLPPSKDRCWCPEHNPIGYTGQELLPDGTVKNRYPGDPEPYYKPAWEMP